ncbi:hypothetical protein [Pasteuria penetrans]|uniref:hypothetical protein n=1 Tax=Pasteuria penetrans TaxID=86005 RepID=UPI000F9137A2|nr:hypothetical protein [Pasteuria penetrans]
MLTTLALYTAALGSLEPLHPLPILKGAPSLIGHDTTYRTVLSSLPAYGFSSFCPNLQTVQILPRLWGCGSRVSVTFPSGFSIKVIVLLFPSGESVPLLCLHYKERGFIATVD